MTDEAKKELSMNIWAVLLAAGQGTRLQGMGRLPKKQFLRYLGLPLFWHSVQIFARSTRVNGVVVAFPAADLDRCKAEVDRLTSEYQPGIPVLCVAGGELRQDSVYCALQTLPLECTHVFVHDAARPFFPPALIHSLIQGFCADVHGVIPGIPCKDTIKEVEGNMVRSTLHRHRLTAVQTPQFYCLKALLHAHKEARKQAFTGTDDASMLELSSYKVRVISGEEKNIKITTIEDLKMLTDNAGSAYPCTGLGYDVHRYGGSRPMVLGGLPIPGAPGIQAHSDGDVLIHALVDAILGCLGRGDIGDLFPDSDPAHENLSSTIFLGEVLALAQAENLELTHIDITLIAQIPRLAPHKAAIASNLSGLTGLDLDRINIKATTEEGLGFTGAKAGIKAMALVTAVRKQKEKPQEHGNIT